MLASLCLLAQDLFIKLHASLLRMLETATQEDAGSRGMGGGADGAGPELLDLSTDELRLCMRGPAPAGEEYDSASIAERQVGMRSHGSAKLVGLCSICNCNEIAHICAKFLQPMALSPPTQRMQNRVDRSKASSDAARECPAPLIADFLCKLGVYTTVALRAIPGAMDRTMRRGGRAPASCLQWTPRGR